jgi:hypothetical protein
MAQAVLEYIRANPGHTNEEIAAALSFNGSTVRSATAGLHTEGDIDARREQGKRRMYSVIEPTERQPVFETIKQANDAGTLAHFPCPIGDTKRELARLLKERKIIKAKSKYMVQGHPFASRYQARLETRIEQLREASWQAKDRGDGDSPFEARRKRTTAILQSIMAQFDPPTNPQ